MRLRKMAALAAAAAMSTTALLANAGAAAAQPTQSAHTPRLVAQQAESQAVQLTDAQVSKLREAWQADRGLTAAEARSVIGLDSAISPATESGSGSSLGNCSEAHLWGDSDGNYTFENEFFPRSAGAALFGSFTFDTDGVLGTADYYNPTGLEQYYADQLTLVGIGSNATLWNGWAVTTRGLWCFGSITAWWE